MSATMTDAATRAAELLKGHRESIDRLDAILVYTLGERFKHTQAVGRLKAEHDLPPSDPARETAQIARLEDLAQRADLDPEFAKKFLRFVIDEVIRHHEKTPIVGRDQSRQTLAISRRYTMAMKIRLARGGSKKTPLLPHRGRRQPHAPRRPLHRKARHLQPAPAQGQRGPDQD